MGTALNDMTIAFLIASEGAELSETLQPWRGVVAQGGRPVLVCPEPREAQLFEQFDHAQKLPVDVPLADADPDDFDALILPGRVADPDWLRTEADAIMFATAFFRAGQPVAAICHAPSLLVEADLVRGRTLTSWPSLRTDVVNAGGHWVDEPVVVCENGPNVLVTSRKPQDLPAFTEAVAERFATAKR